MENSNDRKGKGKKQYTPASKNERAQVITLDSHHVPLTSGRAGSAAEPKGQVASKPQSTNQEEVEEVCFICADTITWYSVGECNHRMCHLCSLRLRALYKQKTCAYCKTDLPEVVYTKDKSKPFQTFNLRTMAAHDKKLNIYFDEPEIYEDVMILLRFNCPDPGCDVACNDGWRELKEHVRKAHGMMMCELCIRHKKLFTHEHTLYTRRTLDVHNKSGDPDDPSFKGHPQCGFCRIHFYSQDELFEHCREKHEQCFLCQRNGIRNQYYQNYAELERHFASDHFPCYHPECLEKKFVVFDSDIDLKGHELETHRDQKNKARGQQIDLNFTYAGSPSQSWERDSGVRRGSAKRGGRGGRGDRGGRNEQGTRSSMPDGSASNAISTTSPQAQQQPEMQREQEESREGARRLRPPPGFGSRLSEPAPQVVAPPHSDATVPSTNTIANQMPTPSEAVVNGISPASSPVNPAEAEVLSKVQHLLDFSNAKVAEFKSLAASFRQSIISSDEFVSAFMSLVLQNKTGKAAKDAENEAGKAWRRLAETIPDDEEDTVRRGKGKGRGISPQLGTNQGGRKKNDMLRAWNDWKIRAHDFPAPSKPATPSYANSAATPSAVLPTSSVAPSAAAARVLVIKNHASKQRFGRGGWAAGPTRSGSPTKGELWDRVAKSMHERDIAEGRSGGSESEEVEKEKTPVTFAHAGSKGGAGTSSGETASSSAADSYPSLPLGNNKPPPVPRTFSNAAQPMRAGLGNKKSQNARRLAEEEFPSLPARPPKPSLARPINGRIGGTWGEESSQGSGVESEIIGKKGKKGKVTLMHFG